MIDRIFWNLIHVVEPD